METWAFRQNWPNGLNFWPLKNTQIAAAKPHPKACRLRTANHANHTNPESFRGNRKSKRNIFAYLAYFAVKNPGIFEPRTTRNTRTELLRRGKGALDANHPVGPVPSPGETLVARTNRRVWEPGLQAKTLAPPLNLTGMRPPRWKLQRAEKALEVSSRCDFSSFLSRSNLPTKAQFLSPGTAKFPLKFPEVSSFQTIHAKMETSRLGKGNHSLSHPHRHPRIRSQPSSIFCHFWWRPASAPASGLRPRPKSEGTKLERCSFVPTPFSTIWRFKTPKSSNNDAPICDPSLFVPISFQPFRSHTLKFWERTGG